MMRRRGQCSRSMAAGAFALGLLAPPTLSEILSTPSAKYPTISSAVEAALDGDEVVIAAGTYTGPANTNIDFDGKSITVRGATGDPEDVIIDCQFVRDRRGFILTSGEEGATISGLTIVNGRAQTGGGILIDTARVTISFVDIRDCFGVAEGGGIWVGGTDDVMRPFPVNITNTTIEGCEAPVGGGVYASNADELNIELSAIFDNLALQSGGGLCSVDSQTNIVSTSLTGNRAGPNGSGGGFALDSGSTSNMTDVQVSDNMMLGETGGPGAGGYIKESTLVLNGAVIAGNTGASNGGGLHATADSNVAVIDSEISQNTAERGGGCYADEGAMLDLENSEIRSNEAPGVNGRGAGLHGENASVSMTSMTITLNATDGQGGGAYLKDMQQVTATDSVVDANIASQGGGLYLAGLLLEPSQLFLVSIVNNIAGSGAGLRMEQGFVPSKEAERLTLQECTVSGNQASTEAGGLLLLGDATNPSFQSCSIDANTAADRAGGLALFDGAAPDFTDCSISGNTVTDSAGKGAGAMCSTFSIATFDGCEVCDNTGPGAQSTGGGFALESGAEVLFTESVICNNQANLGGGVFASGFSVKATALDTALLANSAADGGGIYFSQFPVGDPSLTLNRCIIDRNSGGGMSVFGGVTTVTNSLITGNTSTAGGAGALVNSLSDTQFVNCTFADNTAGRLGGAILAQSSVAIDNCVLWGDQPDEVFGGAADVRYSIVEGGAAGEGNLAIDPMFTDPDGPDDDPSTTADNDYRLGPGSPGIDAGDNLAAFSSIFDKPFLDLLGEDRFVDDPDTPDTGLGRAPIVDIGAYEFQPSPPACPGDVTGDGATDSADLNEVLGGFGDEYDSEDLNAVLGNFGCVG